MAYQTYYPSSNIRRCNDNGLLRYQHVSNGVPQPPSDDLTVAQHHVEQELQISNLGHHHVEPGYSTGWIDCMIEELSSNAMETPPPPPPPPPPQQQQDTRNVDAGASSRLETRSLDDQVNSGVQLVHSLLACAEAIEREDRQQAETALHRIQLLGLPPGPMGKVATHFIDALTRRVYNVTASNSLTSDSSSSSSTPLSELLHFHFYETCPYLKFAHFTANQAILEAFAGHEDLHVIDFNLMHGLQWPALIQALALRPGGPRPRLRLTGIGPPQQLTGSSTTTTTTTDILNEIGHKLHRLAETVNLEFEFRPLVAEKLDDIKPWMLQIHPTETVAVNSILQLHKLLYPTSPPPLDALLRSVAALKPRIFTVVEHEADHNQSSFFGRFTEALHYYSTMFDSMEGAQCRRDEKVELAEMYLGREIGNVVACEGRARVERHERLGKWRARLVQAGFRPVRLGGAAFKQACALLAFVSSEGYRVEESMGCLTLGWHSRPLIASSAWQCP